MKYHHYSYLDINDSLQILKLYCQIFDCKTDRIIDDLKYIIQNCQILNPNYYIPRYLSLTVDLCLDAILIIYQINSVIIIDSDILQELLIKIIHTLFYYLALDEDVINPHIVYSDINNDQLQILYMINILRKKSTINDKRFMNFSFKLSKLDKLIVMIVTDVLNLNDSTKSKNYLLGETQTLLL